jgi:hypothetical protein
VPEPDVHREREVLSSCLNEQRDHVLGILEGLSEEDLRRPVLPTGWTCLGLVQHLAVDVERFWFAPSSRANASTSNQALTPGRCLPTYRPKRYSTGTGRR